MILLQVPGFRMSGYMIRGTDALFFSFKCVIGKRSIDDPGYIVPVPEYVYVIPLYSFPCVIVYCLYMSSLFPLLLPFLLFDFRPVLRS